MRCLLASFIIMISSLNLCSQKVVRGVIVEPILEKNKEESYVLSRAFIVYDDKESASVEKKHLFVISNNNNGEMPYFDSNIDCRVFDRDSLSITDFSKYYLCLLENGSICLQSFINSPKGYKYVFYADLEYDESSKRTQRYYKKLAKNLGIPFSGNVYMLKDSIRIRKMDIIFK